MTIVDAHHHFWKIDRGIYGWISDEISGIRRDYTPQHLSPYLEHLGIGKTVLVQAADTLIENDEMLSIADQSDFVAGVVAWVDLDSATAANELEKLSEHPKVKSIRPMLQGIDDTEWILQPQVLENLKRLPSLGLHFDALIQPRHLNTIVKLADTISDLPIVIDHAAKPIIVNGQAAGATWENGMADLAERPQICCKLSGLATERGPGWGAISLKPISDHLLATFGPNRLMWGSDWPVLELNGSYTQWFNVAKELVAGLSAEEQSWVMGKTATHFYGL